MYYYNTLFGIETSFPDSFKILSSFFTDLSRILHYLCSLIEIVCNYDT